MKVLLKITYKPILPFYNCFHFNEVTTATACFQYIEGRTVQLHLHRTIGQTGYIRLPGNGLLD